MEQQIRINYGAATGVENNSPNVSAEASPKRKDMPDRNHKHAFFYEGSLTKQHLSSLMLPFCRLIRIAG